MTKSLQRLGWTLFVLVLLFGSGCAALGALFGGGESVQATFVGAPEMNSGGNAAVVRVYQLTGRTHFTNTPLVAFWKNDEEALGNELVSKAEVLLYPEARRSVELQLRENTAFVGVAADLHDPDRDEWRAVYPVEAVEDHTLHTTVGTRGIQVEIR